MRQIFFQSILGGLVLLLAASQAQAMDFEQRCDHEWEAARKQGGVSQGEITHDMSRGRHQWLIKCGIMKEEHVRQMQSSYFTSDHFFSFAKNGDIWSVAPFDADAPCEPEATWKFSTTCPHGCFEASEPLLFDGEWMNIPQAFERRQAYISTLAPGSSPIRPLINNRAEVKTYTSGREANEMLSFVLRNKMRITVTKNHPLILATGEVIPAERVHEGQHLLTMEGPSELVKITPMTTAEDVWNVNPIAEHCLDNVFIASGVLTGSLRFQNEWADHASRNFVKESLTSKEVAAFDNTTPHQE